MVNKHVSAPQTPPRDKRETLPLQVPFTRETKGKQGATSRYPDRYEQACKHPPNAAAGLTTNTCLFAQGGNHIFNLLLILNFFVPEFSDIFVRELPSSASVRCSWFFLCFVLGRFAPSPLPPLFRAPCSEPAGPLQPSQNVRATLFRVSLRRLAFREFCVEVVFGKLVW